jgi:hypothetical protein
MRYSDTAQDRARLITERYWWAISVLGPRFIFSDRNPFPVFTLRKRRRGS